MSGMLTMSVEFLTVILLILFNFLESQPESFKVVGPDALTAVAGKDVVLPCSIQPSTSAVDTRIEWIRSDVKDTLVHLYDHHEDVIKKRSYRGRTALFKDELQKGNASLKLSAVKVSDEGVYKCLVKTQTWNDYTIVRVTVEAMGSPPVITLESVKKSGGINLVCESRGWNPEPVVLWLDGEGAELSAKATETRKGNEGFSVKRRLTVHDGDGDFHRFCCRLQQKHHIIQTEVVISSSIFSAFKFSELGRLYLILVATAGVSLITFVYYQAGVKRKNPEEDLMTIKKFKVNVTLDPDTAHPNLIISLDRKQVTFRNTQENLADVPKRFDKCVNILGKEGFYSGKFYYEVLVNGKSDWDLGVARESIKRKGEITLSPQDGFWVVVLRNTNQYKACAGPAVLLSLREKPQKVGVFVDYEEGLVSFYDVEARSHIYSFTGQSFTEKLFPYFGVCVDQKGNNSAPLIISPVSNIE